MDKFTIFPNLPVEIRLMIWRHTFPGPRQVGIKMRIQQSGFNGWTVRKGTPSPPVALQVCNESRQEALKHYTLTFGTVKFPAVVFFDYTKDILSFGDALDHERRSNPSDYLLGLWHDRNFNTHYSKAIQAANIKYLALDVEESIYSRRYFCWPEIYLFERLERLLIVAWDPEEAASELMAYFQSSMNAFAEVHPDWIAPYTEVTSALGETWGRLGLGKNVSTQISHP